MPKVKFLKDLCSGRAGSVQNIQDYEARVLIQLGAAEPYEDPESDKKQSESESLFDLDDAPESSVQKGNKLKRG